ncbi:type II toxin-antitoxin system RelE/ParE family toxin [Mesorhizobium sp. VK23B]|uniref:Type II toxin-antitoxin system RelE/ParE family toxin n=1 Tax=Mesorhizobium dulcispinae TaxID=3072316 RepID=A0ABU4XMI7_9HYPH|nr:MULTISPECIES: type II toxin-antitoxin system RelE/ParE family toxin [unclassified Mesorhizobium]MDX8468436.1 type II toxin-antitoxin system RelE/ParE family toxin [Mesorhizobium sp. VK23B]MDX8474774.1 type II toxin-antitoxin system RelE/ParE family toxin [Mesorhizobium sp. VK23A]
MPATISIESTTSLRKPAARPRPTRHDSRIRAFCERLEYGSERGTRRDDVRPDLRVVGFERRVTVAFIVEPERVVILRLFYGGANWSHDLAEGDAD